MICYLIRICSSLCLPDGHLALERSHGDQAPLERLFSNPAIGIFPLTLTSRLCAIPPSASAFQTSSRSQQSPRKSLEAAYDCQVSRCFGIIGFSSPRRDPDCSHHNGIISSSKNLIQDLVWDLPGNPRPLSALLVTVPSTGGWMEAVNSAALKPFSVI